MSETASTPVPDSAATAVVPKLRARVVREARRETWFVVNEGDVDLPEIPVAWQGEREVRRVDVTGEMSDFGMAPGHVLARPRRPLRAGAGTIIVLHLR